MNTENYKEIKNLFNNLRDSNNNLQRDAVKLVDLVVKSKEDLNLAAYYQPKVVVKKEKSKSKGKDKDKEKNSKKEKKEKNEKEITETAVQEDKNLVAEKYKWYTEVINVENKGSEKNLLYTISRLVGGICSTGNEYRKGFCLALTEILKNYDDKVDYEKLCLAANKESFHKKSENSAIKTSKCIGRIGIFNCIVESSNKITAEILLEICKNTITILESNINTAVEEAAIKLFKTFTGRLIDSSLDFLTNNKKNQRVLETIFSLWMNIANEKSKLSLFGVSISLIFSKIAKLEDSKLNKNIKFFFTNLVKENPKYNIDNNLFNSSDSTQFKTMLKDLVNNNKNHISLEILSEFLTDLADFKYIAVSWNTLTDKSVIETLSKISSKNYQYILTKFSTIIIDILRSSELNFAKIFEIFNSNFFKTFLNFEGGKAKHNNINIIINSLIKALKNMKDSEFGSKINKDLSKYSADVINLFNGHGLSPVTFKGFLLFLFENLSENGREQFVKNLIESSSSPKTNGHSKMEVEIEEDEDEEEDINENDYGDEKFRTIFFTKINVLKTIVTAKSLLTKEVKDLIFAYLVKLYLSKNNNSFQEIITYLEDKVVFIYWSLNSNYSITNKKEEASFNEEDSEENDNRLCKGLLKLNKKVFTMIKEKEISIGEEEYSTFKKALKFAQDFTADQNSDKEIQKKAISKILLKTLLITMVLYLKNPSEFEDTIFDLKELLNEINSKEDGVNKKKKKENSDKHKLSEKFQSVFTEICIQLNSLGSQTLGEFVLKNFKRAASFLGSTSVDVLKNYIKSDN